MGILVDMSGDTLRRFRARVETDRQVVNVLDWDINDVFVTRYDTRVKRRTKNEQRLAVP